MPRVWFSPFRPFLPLLILRACDLHVGIQAGSSRSALYADAAAGAPSPPSQATATPPAGPGDEAEKALAAALEALRDLNLKGSYAECEAGARQLLAKVEASAGPESREAGQVLDLLVSSLWRGGKASEEETLVLARRALQIAEAQFGADSLEAARSANSLGNVFFRRGDLVATRPIWERVLAIREKILGPEHPDVGAALNNLAIIAEQTGDYLGSRTLAERSVAIREKALGPDHRDVATSLNNLGTALGRLGDFDGEKRAQERALAIYEKAVGADHPFTANVLEALCKTEMDRFELAAARNRCTQAVAVREKTLGADHPEVAVGLDNLAFVLLEMRDPVAATGLLERAKTIQEKALGPEHVDLAYTLEQLALAKFRLDRPEEAKVLYRRALAIEEKEVGAQHPRVAEVLSYMAGVYVSLGDLVTAQSLLEQGLKITETALSPDHYAVTGFLADLGDVQVRAGNLDAAEQLFKRAIAIREKYQGPGSYAVAVVLLRQIPIDRARGDVPSLLSHSLQAAGIMREHFRRMAQGLSEREAMEYRENLESGLNDALAALAADPGRSPSPAAAILDELIRSRAMVLDEMGARHRVAIQGLTRGSANLGQALQVSRTRLARLLVRGPQTDEPEQYRRRVQEAEKGVESAERELAVASLEFRSELAQNRAGLAEVRDALPPEAALVAYVKYHPPVSPTSGGSRVSPSTAYLAFVINSKNAAIPVVSLGDATKLESLVEAWRLELHAPEGLGMAGESSETRYLEVATQLREAVWDPVVPHLGGSRQVFIVPDGSMNLVSLAALPAGTNRYLVETGPLLHYLSAERDLVQPSPRAERGHGLLALGGADFDADPRVVSTSRPAPVDSRATLKLASRNRIVYRGAPPDCAEFQSVRFAPLPGSAAEISEIDRLWLKAGQRGAAAREASLILTGAAASESAFKQKAADYRIVHLATHGFFLPDQCESTPSSRTAVAASTSGSRSAGPHHPPDSPLLLSGLAFAGANRRQEAGMDSDVEDGILTSEEIASLSLPGVEWLVLSGCDTGAGRVLTGEGVLGLRRAFQVAGARTLIMSLWRVEDAATTEWMRRLYEARGKGQSTAEAMRQASLGVLQVRRAKGKSAHPYFWGPFIAAGDWK